MKPTRNFEAYLDNLHIVNILLNEQYYGGLSKAFYIENEDTGQQIDLMIKKEDIVQHYGKPYHFYQCTFKEKIEYGHPYAVFHEFARSAPLIFRDITKTKTFDTFFHTKDELGCLYTKEATTFKLWAPTAYRAYVEMEEEGCYRLYPMQRLEKGVYALTLEGDQLGKSYVYQVHVNGEINSLLDPYGKASTLNSKRSIVVDVSSIMMQEYSLKPLNSYCDAIIYEVSIRDYASQGTFRSFQAEALDYIEDLGVTHVQFLPVMDFKSVDDAHKDHFYNWGYDTYQWMAFENSYSSNIHDPMQAMRDFADLVNEMHRRGLRVILDLVFNHIYERENSSLDASVPYYYFQHSIKQGFSSASGCGNDFDSVRLMSRRIILDSCEYLVKTFHVDGFRLDLMGILDTRTVNEIASMGKRYNPDFMLYGEGWNMNSYLPEAKRAAQINAYQMPFVAHFSDRFRDTMKGSTMDVHDRGYLLNDTLKIYKAMNVLGASTQDVGGTILYENASQCINYVEAHDNMTSWDKIDTALFVNEETKKRYHKLLIAAVLLAQGVPFLHGGQEFCRTKKGMDNTYNAPDAINHIDWKRLEAFGDVHQFTKELILVRKRYPCLRQDQGKMIHKHVSYEAIDGRVLKYNVEDENDSLIIFFNPSQDKIYYVLQEGYAMIFYNNLLREEEVPYGVDIHSACIVIFHKSKTKEA